MPVSLPTLFRTGIMLILAAHVFYMYGTARVIGETFGFDPGTAIVSALFALVMLLPFIWAVALPEFPEMYAIHVRGRRRQRTGRCRRCGYQLTTDGAPTAEDGRTICPECGTAVRSPSPYTIGWKTIRLFITINLLAWAIGCAAGEGWALQEERQFMQEVDARLDAGETDQYSRNRRWPFDHATLRFDPESGFSVTG